MVVYVLTASMVGLFIASYFICNQEIGSPAVAFFAPFSLATIDLIYNIDKWKVNLQWNTYIVIIGGSLCFLLAIILTKNSHVKFCFNLNKSPRRKNDRFNVKNIVEYISIPKFNYMLFACLQLVSFVLCLRAVVSIAGRYGYSGGLSAMIGGYKNLKTFTTEDISLGTLCNYLYDFCYCSGFVWIYILANNYVSKKKIEFWALVNLVLSIAISLEKGSRGGAITLVCSCAAMFIFFWQKSSKRGRLSFRQMILIVLAAALVVGSFQQVGELLGRYSSADFGGYLSTYLSAPIRNLDYYLQSEISSPDVFGKMTFCRLINYLGGELNISSWVYELDLPSLYANGYVAGNVYTTFYAYVYDFGYIGVPILMFLMGLISQTVYNKAKSYNCKRHSINLWAVFYSYIFYLVAFSFFSNKFYEGIVSIQFIKYLLFWLLIRFYLEKVKLKIHVGAVYPYEIT